MQTTIELIAKHGVVSLTIIAIVWMNGKMNSMEQKLEKVEEKLYNCLLEKREVGSLDAHTLGIDFNNQWAILPDKQKKICHECDSKIEG